jgi:hypothetical protein
MVRNATKNNPKNLFFSTEQSEALTLASLHAKDTEMERYHHNLLKNKKKLS